MWLKQLPTAVPSTGNLSILNPLLCLWLFKTSGLLLSNAAGKAEAQTVRRESSTNSNKSQQQYISFCTIRHKNKHFWNSSLNPLVFGATAQVTLRVLTEPVGLRGTRCYRTVGASAFSLSVWMPRCSGSLNVAVRGSLMWSDSAELHATQMSLVCQTVSYSEAGQPVRTSWVWQMTYQVLSISVARFRKKNKKKVCQLMWDWKRDTIAPVK